MVIFFSINNDQYSWRQDFYKSVAANKEVLSVINTFDYQYQSIASVIDIDWYQLNWLISDIDIAKPGET